MRRIFNTLRFPDVVTLLNALCGFGAIIATQNGMLHLSCILILMAAIADGLDGSLARHMGGSEIGGTLDSLADVISFGVAPASIIFSYMSGYFMLIAVCFYLICGILRLARFNISKPDSAFFKGLPITAGGITVASIILVGQGYLQSIAMAAGCIILGTLMVSSIPYIKIRSKKRTLPLTLIFAISIVSYFLDPALTSIATIPLMLAMILYIISPVIIKNMGKDIHEHNKKHN
ncbi:CDP-diacylglycerol--serine O-phosphatidyltransferase [Methanomethylovorans hollandica DSM 15978]|uniref:CDP-diacylglycerol--serine O-phosphatidyltransferase n=1 Tax=Methanomethylovorans hollandica (strain DSM 15978 / NBRC 107637 / DMS1) TaxID=867904 RepID=L0KVK2_METHD|nr:archaetidylserine synthase [Methanomethylovorans hollandica]AGB48720.1 CDP-diacylglycerol--serine O-phosphatidyltransferase [Methanomethylovorans hollandica DSM 15978]